MKYHSFRRAAAPLVAAALVLAACGDDSDSDDTAPEATDAETADDGTGTDPDTTAPDEPDADDDTSSATASGECPSEGGTLTIGDAGEFRGFDPLVTTSTSGTTGGHVLVAMYDALMYWNPDTGDFEPWVAESLEHNDDLTEWTVTLRDGIEFGNGDPLTAEAVQASIERSQSDLNVTGTLRSATQIIDITVVDDLTVVLTMDEPNGGVPAMLATGIGMITNPAVIDSTTPEEFNLGVPGAGVGPFEPTRFAPGEEVIITAKDNYWGGQVCLDDVRFVGVGDQDSRFDAFDLGEFDVVQLRGGYTAIEEIARPAGMTIYTEVRNASGAIFLNGGLPLSDPSPIDVRIRRAVAHAIDVDSVDQRVDNGYGLPSASIIHPQSTLYAGGEGPAYDPDLARELVDEVLAEGEWDGTFELICPENSIDTCITVEALLEAVGFDVTVETMTIGGVIDMYSSEDREFNAVAWSFSMGDQRPHEVLELNLARMGYDDDELNELIDQLSAATSIEEQQNLMLDIQDRWNEIVPAAILSGAGQSWVSQDNVGGLQYTMGSIIRLDSAWID